MSRLTSPPGRPGASAAHPSSAAQASQPHGAPPHLARSLSNRHIQLIAIGGAIGTGLFMGSGKTISLAGPSVIFVYMIIGFMLFFVMRAMGELLLSNLEYKSFSDFAGDLLGPWASFFTSWTYWLCWIVTAIAELIAIALYASFWWPDLPLWIPALGAVLVLLAFNLTSVKAFGETEFWFALIKIIAIVTLIVVGLVMVFTNFVSPGGTPASFTNLWNDGGMFPTGPMGFIAGFQLSVFAFLGVELVGTTAAEAQHPEKNLPKAINSIPLRIMLFYVLALIMIMTVTPWREVTADVSPFVAMFALAGLGAAAAVINFVVLTSATSSANSGLYSTSRMLFGLSVEGTAPGRFQRLTQHKVPANALLFSCMFLLVSAVLLYASSSIIEVFTVVTTMASVLFIFVWAIIVVSYIVYRRRRPALHAASKFKMPGGVYMSYVLLAFFVFLIWALTQKADTLQALLVTPVWFLGLGIVWLVLRRRPEHRARQSLHEAAVRIDASAAAEWTATRG